MYKVLITTRTSVISMNGSGASVHSLIATFSTVEEARLAVVKINNTSRPSYTQTALALYDEEESS